MPRTLILEPTRELAAQVEEAFGKYGVNHKLNLALLIGGVSFGDQEAKITRGADVLIATPGRLLDFAERGKILLTGIEILVIDEADRMLDMGFIPDIERICKLVPFTRQTLFFSATMPPEITRLTETVSAQSGSRRSRPRRHDRRRDQPVAGALRRSPEEKRATLRRLVRSAENFKNAIIFCNRKRDVAMVASLAGEARLFRRRAAWRSRSARAHGLARLLPQRPRPIAGLLRRRRARPRHSRRQPRHQLRRARTTPKTMCTASAAPAAPANGRRADHRRARDPRRSTTSRSSSATRSNSRPGAKRRRSREAPKRGA